MNSFPLERREETFRDGVIVAIACPTHATGDPLVPQKVLELLASVLTAAIAVVNQARRWRALAQRHPKSLQY